MIEPRARTGKRKGEIPFPGADGIRGTAGEGSLNALRGVCVTLSEQGAPPTSTFTGVTGELTLQGGLIEMSGPGAQNGLFGKLHNIVLLAYPAEGVHNEDYATALKVAGLRAAAYIGRAGEDLKPDSVEVFELSPVPEIARDYGDLPKVGLIFQVHWGQWYAAPDEPIYYGDDLRRHQPTIIPVSYTHLTLPTN